MLSEISCIKEQFHETVVGDGNVMKKERQTAAFNGINVSSGINVFIKQADAPYVAVEADENLHTHIKTEVMNGILNIYSDTEIKKANEKKVYVNIKEVTYLSVSGAGNLTGEAPVRAGKLKLSASSAGDIQLEVYAGEITADLSSSGDITLSGEVYILMADLSSAAILKAYNLSVKEARVSVSSAGAADIFVTEKLTARASSAGEINYKGNPKQVDTHSSSAGGIHRK